jgi:hypothetical protein
MRRTLLNLAFVLAACGMSLSAQAPPASAKGAQQIHADLNQLMRGVMYPAANVVFYAQADDPEESAKAFAGDPGMATDPIKAAFGGWQAVQNAALALAESANLLTMEGRRCSNGTPVPTGDPSWVKFSQELRDASMKAYAAAQARSIEKSFEASEALSANCAGCHRQWRDRRKQPRCQ